MRVSLSYLWVFNRHFPKAFVSLGAIRDDCF